MAKEKTTTKKTAPAKKPAKPEQPATLGRGKKQCPKCQTITGARSANCPSCGHDFKTAKPAKKKATTKKTDSPKTPTAKPATDLTSQLKAEKARLEKQLTAIDTLLGE